MLIYAGAALFMTMVVGYLYETLKERASRKAVNRTNGEIERLLKNIELSDDNLDVFTVNEIRQMFKEKLLDQHRVDDFKLYKKDNRHMALTYKKQMLIQSLELTLDKTVRAVSIGHLEIIENPFEEIHL